MDDLDGILTIKLDAKSEFGARMDNVCDAVSHTILVMFIGLHYGIVCGIIGLIAVAAIITGIVAIKGLHSWKTELHGKVKFNIARDLIRATYALREEIKYCRSPFTSSSEFPKDYDPINAQDNAKTEANAWVHI